MTGCVNESTITLKTIEIPIAHTIEDLIGCDDDNDGISEYFDTSNVESQVLKDQTGMEISYYDQNGIEIEGPLPNYYTNTIPYNEVLTVRVTDPKTTCFSETILQLKTLTKPTINQPGNLYACDQGNGYAEFDTSHIEQILIGNQAGLIVKYFDAQYNQLPSPLPLLFKNTVSNSANN